VHGVLKVGEGDEYGEHEGDEDQERNVKTGGCNGSSEQDEEAKIRIVQCMRVDVEDGESRVLDLCRRMRPRPGVSGTDLRGDSGGDGDAVPEASGATMSVSVHAMERESAEAGIMLDSNHHCTSEINSSKGSEANEDDSRSMAHAGGTDMPGHSASKSVSADPHVDAESYVPKGKLGVRRRKKNTSKTVLTSFRGEDADDGSDVDAAKDAKDAEICGRERSESEAATGVGVGGTEQDDLMLAPLVSIFSLEDALDALGKT